MENGELVTLKKDVSVIKSTLAEVHDAIVGNKLTKDGGLSKRLTEAEEKIELIEGRLINAEKKQIKYNVYTVIMWVCIGGVSMAIFLYMLPLIFKYKS